MGYCPGRICGFEGGEEETGGLAESRRCEWREKMITYQNPAVFRLEEIRKVEIHPERVAEWTLIFTNMFFLSYFFAKLIEWV